jgi:biotin operon repressor
MTSALEFDDCNVMLQRIKNQRVCGTAPMRKLQIARLSVEKHLQKVQR